jgi:hypothetical protein
MPPPVQLVPLAPAQWRLDPLALSHLSARLVQQAQQVQQAQSVLRASQVVPAARPVQRDRQDPERRLTG